LYHWHLSVPFNNIAKLILELNIQFGDIPFNNLANNFLGVKIPKINHLSTRIAFIMVPLLHSVPDPLQQPSTDHALSLEHFKNLIVHMPRQETRPRPVDSPLVFPLLTQIVLQSLFISHIRIHLNRLCLLHQPHIDAAKPIRRLPRALAERNGNPYCSIRVGFPFQINLLKHARSCESLQLLLKLRLRVNPTRPQRNHLEERVLGAHFHFPVPIEEHDLGNLVLLEPTHFVQLDHDVRGQAVRIPFLRLRFVGNSSEHSRQEPSVFSAAASISAEPSSISTSSAAAAVSSACEGVREEGGERCAVEENGGCGGDGDGFEERRRRRRGI